MYSKALEDGIIRNARHFLVLPFDHMSDHLHKIKSKDQ